MALFNNKQRFGLNLGIPPDNDPWKFVSNPNDPAYKSYSDSLSLYSNSIRAFNKVNSTLAFPMDYYKDMSPLDHRRHYERTDVSKQKIQPIGWHEMAYFNSNSDPYVYKRPTNPVFLKGTELANNAEKQIMLQKAGLYKGNIDGIWGNKSITAMQQYERQQQNTTPIQPTNQSATPVTQQPIVETKPTVPKVVSSVSKDYGAYTSTSGKSPNIAEFNSFGSSTNTKGDYYTIRFSDGTTEILTPSEYEQSLYKSSKNKAFKKTANL